MDYPVQMLKEVVAAEAEERGVVGSFRPFVCRDPHGARIDSD